MTGKWHVTPIVAVLAIVAAAGCSSATSGTGSAAASHASALATSTAVAKVKDAATACVQKTGKSALTDSAARDQLISCLQNIVPPAQRQAFKNCVLGAAVTDKIWTSDGWDKFINTSLQNCVNTA